MINLQVMHFDLVPGASFDLSPWIMKTQPMPMEVAGRFPQVTWHPAQLFRALDDPTKLVLMQAGEHPGQSPVGHSRVRFVWNSTALAPTKTVQLTLMAGDLHLGARPLVLAIRELATDPNLLDDPARIMQILERLADLLDAAKASAPESHGLLLLQGRTPSGSDTITVVTRWKSPEAYEGFRASPAAQVLAPWPGCYELIEERAA